MKISEYLCEFLKNGNINKNDRLIFHSDIRILYKDLIKKKFKFTLNDIADHFIEYIGNKGTLIIPTFNFNFCNGENFSIKNTKSQMGVLSEVFRKKAGKNRSWHPVYSFVIFGNIPMDYLNKKNYSAYGKSSLFHWLTLSDGKIAIVDLPDQNSMTYYHHVEELMNASWRYHKDFEGDYINFDNIKEKTAARIFVRKLSDGIVTDVKNMEKILWKKRLYKSKNNFSQKGCRSIKVQDLKKEVTHIINSNKAEGILYKINKLIEK